MYYTFWMFMKRKPRENIQVCHNVSPTSFRQVTDILPTHYQLSVGCRPTVGRLSADRQPIFRAKSVGRLTAGCRPTVGRLLVDTRPTVGQQSADCRSTDGRQLTDSRPTGFWGGLLLQIHRSGDASIYRSTDPWIYRSTDPSIYRSTDLLIY